MHSIVHTCNKSANLLMFCLFRLNSAYIHIHVQIWLWVSSRLNSIFKTDCSFTFSVKLSAINVFNVVFSEYDYKNIEEKVPWALCTFIILNSHFYISNNSFHRKNNTANTSSPNVPSVHNYPANGSVFELLNLYFTFVLGEGFKA